jgi:hypothetical protein
LKRVVVELSKCARVRDVHEPGKTSTKNMDLCLSIGADEVLDYTKRPLLEQLRDVAAQIRPFDHVVDNDALRQTPSLLKSPALLRSNFCFSDLVLYYGPL